MFTPPPSPLPPRRAIDQRSPSPLATFATGGADVIPNLTPTLARSTSTGSIASLPSPLPSSSSLPLPPSHTPLQKRRVGYRTTCLVLLLPLVLVIITFTTRHFQHPAVLDLFSEAPRWDMVTPAIHKRHPQNDDNDSSSSATTPTPTIPASSQPLPTVPTDPTIPTPFPQPFDSSLTQNFSSLSCFNFFQNMTSSRPFRTCRPFSLLLQSSNAFLNAQTNLTLLNNLVWGTCHTNPGMDECTANMGWFANNLQTACSTDLRDRNALAVETLIGLNAFQVMYDAGCLTDPTTNSYCFVNAARSSSPVDLYFYQLALGTKLPSRSVPSCSACTRSVLRIFAAALESDTQGRYADGLEVTYVPAAQAAVQACGSDYATTETSGATALVLGVPSAGRVHALMASVVMLLWSML
ncbi:hypothetical protein AX16_008210 [Volvariella volvacea WC 439]|nr:hypothetical protein AX16_008210 [Volvariella volvacea WC 439]